MWVEAWLTIIARGRAKYRDLPVTNKSRYFAKTEFNSVAEYVSLFIFFQSLSATLPFSRKATKEGEKRANEKGEKFAWNYNDDDLLDCGNFLQIVSVFNARTFENFEVFYS